MFKKTSNLLIQLGTRICNYGYLLANPTYSIVRGGKGCGDLYRLLNKNWFHRNKIQLVLDVGANEGQFIKTSLALMPKVPVYAFEPNPNLVQKLQKSHKDTEKVKIFPVALGSKPGTLPLNISNFSPASSFLNPSSQVISEFPETKIENTIEVKVERLDTLIQNTNIKQDSCLLKIDVQGFELEVLKGATTTFALIDVIVCEVNLAHLYDGQSTLESLVSFLKQYNYQLVDINLPVYSRSTHEILYVDLAFKKKCF
jgi:FkbM family methyltransferase